MPGCPAPPISCSQRDWGITAHTGLPSAPSVQVGGPRTGGGGLSRTQPAGWGHPSTWSNQPPLPEAGCLSFAPVWADFPEQLVTALLARQSAFPSKSTSFPDFQS